MSDACSRPINVINLIGLLRLCIVVPVALWLRTLDVLNVHLISDEFGRSDCSHLDLGEHIGRVQWISADAVSRELHTLGICTLDICDVQVRLGFV